MVALPLVFRSSHSWTQLSQDGWNMEKEKKQNNPQQPNTLAVAHVDSACQFSQSRFPTQITDCWIWRTPCVCVCVCAGLSVAGPGEVGGCNRKASCTAGSRCVDLASLAAKPRPLEKHGLPVSGSFCGAGSRTQILQVLMGRRRVQLGPRAPRLRGSHQDVSSLRAWGVKHSHSFRRGHFSAS